MELVERDALLFEAGEYPDKGITVTEEDLDQVIANTTAAVPIKIEHSDTPFDGALGTVGKLYRKGRQLWGRVAMAAEAWVLAEKANAKRLSVGLSLNPHALVEVSLVRFPRVEAARVFSAGKGVLMFAGAVNWSLGDLSASEVQQALEEAFQGRFWVVELYEEFCIVSDGYKYFRVGYSVADGKVSVEAPAEVRRRWDLVEEPRSAAMSAPEEEKTMATETTFSQADLDRARTEAGAAAEEETSKRLAAEFAARRETERKAMASVIQFTAAGKITEAQTESALALAQAAPDAFAAFMAAIPEPEKPAPVTMSAKAAGMLAALGVKPDDIAEGK